jgi:transitional endoplasmic reticulum ATPase
VTSEQPRWNIHEYFAAEGWNSGTWYQFLAPDADFDLYLVWDEGDEDRQSARILALRQYSDSTNWDAYSEGVADIDSDSFHVIQVGLERAIADGLLPESNPRVETGRMSALRSELPEIVHGIPVRDQALYLGGTRVDHKGFELYLSERSTTAEHSTTIPALVFVIATDTSVVSRWYEDGSVVPQIDRKDGALREAMLRAREQGFRFHVDDRNLKQLEDTSGVIVPEPTTRAPKILQKGPEAQMTTPQSSTLQFTNVTIAESPDETIHLPAGMSHAKAREWLTNDERSKEQEIQWSAGFDAYPLDGALALRRVLERRFGSAIKSGATEQTFFGDREVPPYMIEVQVGVNQVQHVPWGHFTIPLMPDCKIEAGVDYREKQLFFQLTGKIKRKYKPIMDEIAAQVREELKVGSIYKGKAFMVTFPSDEEAAQRGYHPKDYAPKFIDVADPQDQLILSDHVQEQIETNLFAPVIHTARCRKLGIPLKRGVLLAGKYGTGKTLTASLLSRLCIQNGWTFVYLKDVADLDRAMRFANRYAPAVIFAEDIDRAMEQKEGSARDQAMNDILNTIDGVDMKHAELMVVLTTNFLEKINKAMLRPGRLDVVIPVDPPDESAVIRLMRHYANGLLDHATDGALLAAAEQLAGQIPAIIREVVERSKLAAICRADDTDQILLEGEDLRIAAQGMISHIRLLEDPPADERSDLEKAADTIVSGMIRVSSVSAIVNGLSNGAKPIAPKVVVSEAL